MSVRRFLKMRGTRIERGSKFEDSNRDDHFLYLIRGDSSGILTDNMRARLPMNTVSLRDLFDYTESKPHSQENIEKIIKAHIYKIKKLMSDKVKEIVVNNIDIICLDSMVEKEAKDRYRVVTCQGEDSLLFNVHWSTQSEELIKD